MVGNTWDELATADAAPLVHVDYQLHRTTTMVLLNRGNSEVAEIALRQSNLKIFDPHIRSRTQSDDDLKNLHYFGTDQVLTTAFDAQPFETAAELIQYFEFLIDEECARLRRCGLNPTVAIGVVPDARPRRAHYEVWDALASLIGRAKVVAVGEIGVWKDDRQHWELFQRQVRIAHEAGPLPLVVTPPTDLKITLTYKMMTWLKKFGYPPSLVMMSGLDERLVKNVVESGFCAGIPVGAGSNAPRQMGDFLARLLADVAGADNILLTTALRSAGGDVLGVPKTIVALREAGVSDAQIAKMVCQNAERLFGAVAGDE